MDEWVAIENINLSGQTLENRWVEISSIALNIVLQSSLFKS